MLYKYASACKRCIAATVLAQESVFFLILSLQPKLQRCHLNATWLPREGRLDTISNPNIHMWASNLKTLNSPPPTLHSHPSPSELDPSTSDVEFYILESPKPS
jgi:hypothetical protein